MRFLLLLKIKIILRNLLLGKAVQGLENPFQLLFEELRKGWPQRLGPACRWRVRGEGCLQEAALRGRWPHAGCGLRCARALAGAVGSLPPH